VAKVQNTVKVTAEEESVFDAIENRFVQEGRDANALNGIRELRKWYERAEDTEPPLVAEFILDILSTSKPWQNLIGDMREQFARDQQEVGRATAVRRYWAQLIRSLMPFVLRGMKKASAFVDGSLVTRTSSSVNTYFHDIATNKVDGERK
jgi:hypothetical protein